jgi:hypothetical protein
LFPSSISINRCRVSVVVVGFSFNLLRELTSSSSIGRCMMALGHDESFFHVYARRWYILAVFSLLGWLQSVLWITYSPVARMCLCLLLTMTHNVVVVDDDDDDATQSTCQSMPRATTTPDPR